MTKIIAIGDIHGRDIWKKIIEQEKDFDRVIFIGDYFDSWDKMKNAKQIETFCEIIKFKKDNPEKVILLLGNHDYHYLPITDQKYSGYQTEFSPTIETILRDAWEKGMIMACAVEGKFMFTHAGVTKTWCKEASINLESIEGSINKCFMFTPKFFEFMNFQGGDPSGDNTYQSPIWVRPDSLISDMIEGYTQVVGHTGQDKITIGHPIFIDVLYSSKEYLVINNDVPEVKKIV